MKCFASVEMKSISSTCQVMQTMGADKMPVMNALADEFVLMDEYFASHPGPTWPNRLFMLTGTSAGLTETIPWYNLQRGKLFPQPTFFDQVEEHGGTARLYYGDSPWELFIESVASHPERMAGMEQFYEDVSTGALPSFSFINPRCALNMTTGMYSNDMHPDHDIALGEQLYKDIYEALRAGPAWNETLFIINFDEHGGFYDHVTPPSDGVPHPGDKYQTFGHSYPDSFNFERLGMRVPFIMASPWLPKGKVVSEPPSAQKPFNTSRYEHTSVMATARKLLGMDAAPLTKRDAWAATFEHLFEELDEPRTDCPTKLPDAPPPSHTLAHEANLPLNPLQDVIVKTHLALQGELKSVDELRELQQQGQVGPWLQERLTRHTRRASAWQHGKQTGEHNTFSRRVIMTEKPKSSEEWQLVRERDSSSTTGHLSTISVKLNLTYKGVQTEETFCLDGGSPLESGNTVSVTVCYPSVNPLTNRDPSQLWIFGQGHATTVSPATRPDLCLTAGFPLSAPTADISITGANGTLSLQPCGGGGVSDGVNLPQLNQRFMYFWGKGQNIGSDNFGSLSISWLTWLDVVRE